MFSLVCETARHGKANPPTPSKVVERNPPQKVSCFYTTAVEFAHSFHLVLVDSPYRRADGIAFAYQPLSDSSLMTLSCRSSRTAPH
jgi:hypothetical protein